MKTYELSTIQVVTILLAISSSLEDGFFDAKSKNLIDVTTKLTGYSGELCNADIILDKFFGDAE